ncbi:DUF4817 domain-containing protein [Trichonephila clavipes]|uniref:DUF4817 domain-containing protein n=1 Tax=Trichonephila clavipes TaxID=2585209 RepID=A0A8X6WKG6_TRICX|nr:DUF4817 domain-containing protein [Trichonephila clavipes]
MYSIEERVFLVLEYHRLQESPTATRRSFQTRFNVLKGPDAKTIRTLFAKFQRTGSVTDDLVGNVGRKQTAVTPQNVSPQFLELFSKIQCHPSVELHLRLV